MSDEKSPGCGELLAMLVVMFAVSIGATLVTALALADMWRWFVVATLHVPQLPFWSALGVLMLARLLQMTALKDPDENEKPTWRKVLYGPLTRLGASATTWGTGWLLSEWSQ